MNVKIAFIIGLALSLAMQMIYPINAGEITAQEFFRQGQKDIQETVQKITRPGEMLYYRNPIKSGAMHVKERSRPLSEVRTYHFHDRSPASENTKLSPAYQMRSLYIAVDGNQNYYMGQESINPQGGFQRTEAVGKTAP